MQREKGQASEKQFTGIYTSSAFSLLKYEWNGTWKLQLTEQVPREDFKLGPKSFITINSGWRPKKIVFIFKQKPL